MTGSAEGAPARHYTWPPFVEGNEVATTHGAWSPRLVAPVAVELERQAREDPSWPSYLNDASYDAAIADLYWTEAQILRMRAWQAGEDVAELITEVTDTEGTEQVSKGRVSRRSTSRRRGASLDSMLRLMAHAHAVRKELGLTPMSRFRMRRDVAATEVSLVELLTQAREAHEAAQQAQEAPDDDQ